MYLMIIQKTALQKDLSSIKNLMEIVSLSEDEIKDNAELEDYELDPDDYNDSEDE